ncbi:MAG: TIGR04442 family protein [Chrysiogenetes bacterium]|nr:TIGR04442 family protein [Chrysiogenetes bacterium]
MIRDFTLHGQVDERIEYYAMVMGPNLERHLYSFELGGTDDDYVVRFFSRGNELTLDGEGVTFRGTGGSFCEYMFGVDLPYDDLTRADVCNRLIVHGALQDMGGDGLKFTARTAGRESYDSIFLNGNAVSNFYFFISPSDPAMSVLEIQRELLRLTGKKLKRLQLSSQREGGLSHVTHSLMEWLGDLAPNLFVIELTNRTHRTYYDECRQAFLDDHDLIGAVEVGLVARAQELGIDQYTRERIKIDMVYKHPENKSLIDEYKRLLVEASTLDVVPTEVVARLSRLRTLSLRRRIPEVILTKLDHKFPLSARQDTGEPVADHFEEARTILEGLFLTGTEHVDHDKRDLESLIRAKHRATLTHASKFEEILLETGRRIDEAADRDEAPPEAVQQFTTVVTYFDRYDACSETINHLSFIGESSLQPERIRSLRNNYEAFNQIKPGLFEECFFGPLLENKYLSGYGRKKIQTLQNGLKDLTQGEESYSSVAERLAAIAQQEKNYNLLGTYFRNNMQLAYLYKSGEPADRLHQKVTTDLFVRGLIKEPIPLDIFHVALQHILEEDFYVTEVLPQIVGRKDTKLRLDFLTNSGLDLFRIEELEKEYLERNRFPEESLPPIETLGLPNPQAS